MYTKLQWNNKPTHQIEQNYQQKIVSCFYKEDKKRNISQSLTDTHFAHLIFAMKLSPLRKEVQSLNQQLLSQNVQIQDLITFLKKQPKSNQQSQKRNQVNYYASPNNYLNKISNKKTQTISAFHTSSQNKLLNKQNLHKESLQNIKPFHPTSNEGIFKPNEKKQISMAKSVTFHNIQNALTARRYLKLSRPQRKLNASCTICRQPSPLIDSNLIKQTIYEKHSPIFQTNQNSRHISGFPSQKKSFKSVQKFDDRQKMKSNSKTKRKVSERELPKTQKKKNPLKQLDSNEILSKNQMKKFIEKKSLPTAKTKAKLLLKDQKIQQIKHKQKK